MSHLEIRKAEVLYAIVVKSDEVEDGLKFYTQESDFLQMGTWKYPRGKALKAHAHKICERTSNLTQEFIIVKKGALRLDVYDKSDALLTSVTMRQGDFGILLNGGHGYEILEDATEVVEVKNGPYLGLESDKRMIE